MYEGRGKEEAQMVLPAIQALFGLRMVAVFNQRFEQLSNLGQTILRAHKMLKVIGRQ
jgi:hypothetical protein